MELALNALQDPGGGLGAADDDLKFPLAADADGPVQENEAKRPRVSANPPYGRISR